MHYEDPYISVSLIMPCFHLYNPNQDVLRQQDYCLSMWQSHCLQYYRFVRKQYPNQGNPFFLLESLSEHYLQPLQISNPNPKPFRAQNQQYHHMKEAELSFL